jgi:hypothetical protein
MRILINKKINTIDTPNEALEKNIRTTFLVTTKNKIALYFDYKKIILLILTNPSKGMAKIQSILVNIISLLPIWI